MWRKNLRDKARPQHQLCQWPNLCKKESFSHNLHRKTSIETVALQTFSYGKANHYYNASNVYLLSKIKPCKSTIKDKKQAAAPLNGWLLN